MNRALKRSLHGVLATAVAVWALVGCGVSTTTTPTATTVTATATSSSTSAPQISSTSSGGPCNGNPCIGDWQKEAAEGGTVVQCADGTWSHAGGIQGACSDHGGESGSQPSTGQSTQPNSTSPTPAPAQPTGFSSCDQNISATRSASCQFAENVFYEAWSQWNSGSWNGQDETSFDAYSPVTGQSYPMSCQNSEGSGAEIICTNGSDTTAQVEFGLAAIKAYTQSEASAYAASGKLGR